MDGAASLGVVIDVAQAEQMQRHALALLQWNRRTNLTAVTAPKDVAVKHYVDSLAPLPFIPVRGRLLDVGSGGGFPGLPLKIARSRLEVTLLDAARKKITFLKHAIHSLALDRITAHQARLEALAGSGGVERFDMIVSRAFGRLDALVAACLPLLATGGRMLLLMGPQIDAEVAQLETARTGKGVHLAGRDLKLKVVAYRLPELDAARRLVILQP